MVNDISRTPVRPVVILCPLAILHGRNLCCNSNSIFFSSKNPNSMTSSSFSKPLQRFIHPIQSNPSMMEGSVEEENSWKLPQELDQGMNRMILSRKSDSPSSVVVNQVDPFLFEALQIPRERLSILRMEQEVEKFILDPSWQQLEFQQLPTSYLRLAAHRVAQHYYLQSIVIVDNNLPDGSGVRIIEYRLPPVRLADIAVSVPQEDTKNVIKLAIKQRPQKQSQIANGANSHASESSNLKSMEERKEEYNRARAGIFSSNSSDDADGRPQLEPSRQDNSQHHSISTRIGEKTVSEVHQVNLGRGSSGFCSDCGVPGRGGTMEPVGRYNAKNKVAIIRDREVDLKDPDYDRSYERYMQRFDPWLGFNGRPYNMQLMFPQSLSYGTEFPQFGLTYRPQICLKRPPHSIHQHLNGPWPEASTSAGIINCGYPERVMASFGCDHVGASYTSNSYMDSSLYSFSCHVGPFISPCGHAHQPFLQPQQHSEAIYGAAWPR